MQAKSCPLRWLKFGGICYHVTGSCGAGYILSDNGFYDIPGDGSVNGVGNLSRVLTCQTCADLCTADAECGSYECSNSTLLCNLNESPNATAPLPAGSDYTFCKKDFGANPPLVVEDDPTDPWKGRPIVEFVTTLNYTGPCVGNMTQGNLSSCTIMSDPTNGRRTSTGVPFMDEEAFGDIVDQCPQQHLVATMATSDFIGGLQLQHMNCTRPPPPPSAPLNSIGWGNASGCAEVQMDVCMIVDASGSMEYDYTNYVMNTDCKNVCTLDDCGVGCTDYSKTVYACQQGNRDFNRTGLNETGECNNFQVQMQILYDLTNPQAAFHFDTGYEATQWAAWDFSGKKQLTVQPTGADMLGQRRYLDGCRFDDSGCTAFTGTEPCTTCADNIVNDSYAIWPNYQYAFAQGGTFLGEVRQRR